MLEAMEGPPLGCGTDKKGDGNAAAPLRKADVAAGGAAVGAAAGAAALL